MPQRRTQKDAIRDGGLNEVAKPRRLRRASVEAAEAAGEGAAPRFTIEDILTKVEELCSTGEFELAVLFCDKALQMAPGSARALEYKAIALQELGNVEEASAALQEAIESEPDAGASKFLYLGQLSEGESAVAAFTEAIRIMNGEMEALGESGAPEAALAPLARDVAEAFCSIAEIYLTDLCEADGAQEACVDCCERALQLVPECAQAMQTMASVSISIHQPKAALSWMRQSLALWHHPDAPEGGEVDADSAAAASAAAAAAGAGPEDESKGGDNDRTPPYDFRANSAKILMELGEHDVAAEVLEQLLLEDDVVVEVWYLLGLAQRFGGADDALATLCRAKLLYALTESTQEGILAHLDQLLGEYPPADVDEQLTGVARTLGPAAEELLAKAKPAAAR